MALYIQIANLLLQIIIFLSHPAFGYIQKDYEIFDLQYNSSSFIQEISQWNVSNFTSNQSYAYSYCDGIPLLGGIGNIGPNTTFTRTYTNLTNHNLTVFFIEFWIFSTSNTTNDIQITIQNETSIAYQTVLSTKFDQALWISDICGVPGASGLKSLTVYVGVSGINSTATITIENVNMLDSTFLQYGIRNVGMTLLLVPSYSKDSSCAISNVSSVITSQICPFLDRYYWDYSNRVYNPCDDSCEQCIFQASPSYCLSCEDQYFYNGTQCLACDSSCQSCLKYGSDKCLSCHPGYYLFSNSTCQPNCTYPYVQRTQNNIIYCDLKCKNELFTYSNGSCIATCLSPFVQRVSSNQKSCSFPCDSSHYLLPNGSCLASCIYPLQQVNRSEGNYCNSPCLSTQYFLYNGTCSDQCSSLFVQVNKQDILYCNYPCNTMDFLYQNGSCISVCSYPFQIRQENYGQYCDFPCTSSQYLHESSNTCLESCIFPMIMKFEGDSNYCQNPCSNSTFYYSKERICGASCTDPYTTNQTEFYNTCEMLKSFENILVAITTTSRILSVGITVTSIISSQSSAGVTLAVLARMFVYLRYLNIPYSPSLKLTLKTWKSNFILLNLGVSMPKSLINKLNSGSLPPVFAEWDLYPSFLANFWQEFASFVIIISILLLLRTLEWAVYNSLEVKYSHVFLQKIRKIVQSILLILLYNSFGDILLFTILQIISHQSLSNASVISYFIATVFDVTIYFVLWRHLRLTLKRQKLKRQITSPEIERELFSRLEKENEHLSMLFWDFKEQYFSQQAFLFFFAMRDILFNLIIAALFSYPLVQTILISLLSVLMLTYLLIRRPLKRLIDEIQYVFCELALLSTNLCALSLAAMETRETQETQSSDFLNKTIIFIIFGFNFVIAALLGVKSILQVKELLKYYIKRQAKLKIVPQSKMTSLTSSYARNRKQESHKFVRNMVEIYRHNGANKKALKITPPDIFLKSNIDSEVDPTTTDNLGPFNTEKNIFSHLQYPRSPGPGNLIENFGERTPVTSLEFVEESEQENKVHFERRRHRELSRVYNLSPKGSRQESFSITSQTNLYQSRFSASKLISTRLDFKPKPIRLESN